jgi:hypothetical protein
VTRQRAQVLVFGSQVNVTFKALPALPGGGLRPADRQPNVAAQVVAAVDAVEAGALPRTAARLSAMRPRSPAGSR